MKTRIGCFMSDTKAKKFRIFTKKILDDDEVRRVAKWAHLKQLYRFESERRVKLSDLNEISIAPKPIEK